MSEESQKSIEELVACQAALNSCNNRLEGYNSGLVVHDFSTYVIEQDEAAFTTIESYRSQQRTLNRRVKDLNDSLGNLRVSYSTLNTTLHRCYADVNKLRNSAIAARSTSSSSSTDISLKHCQRMVNLKEQELQDSEDDLKDNRAELSLTLGKLRDQDAKIQEIENTLTDRLLERASLNNSLNTCRALLFTVRSKSTACDKELQLATNGSQGKDSEISTLESTLESTEQKLVNITQESGQNHRLLTEG